MIEPTDKRTTAYKQWKSQQETKKVTIPLTSVVTGETASFIGLGDIVETITEATGIKKVVEFIAGDDCGCKERKEKLNKIKLPVRRSAKRCFNEHQ